MNRNPDASDAPVCPGRRLSRREFLATAALAAVAMPALAAETATSVGRSGPRAVTSIALCKRYRFPDVKAALGRLLDELGDVRRLVRRKHVTIKVNLVNSSQADLAGIPLTLTTIVHPVVAQALGSLLVDYGARQVTFCDQLPFRPLAAEAFAGYGYNLSEFNSVMRGRARFANTRNRGPHRDYAVVKIPGGGELATGWEVNRAYMDTDVLVSLAKLKSHVSAGLTGGMKNLFGIPPSSLYGNDAAGEPNENAIDYRDQTMHNCSRKPVTSTDLFTGRSLEGDHGYNVPRFIVDLNAAFLVHLTVIDGISTVQAAEGWWLGSVVSVTRPGLLIAGRNAVCTDAVAAAVMGFDPDAPNRSWPFINGTNYLRLARTRGLGENRISELEIAGVPLERARFEFEPTYRRKAP